MARRRAFRFTRLAWAMASAASCHSWSIAASFTMSAGDLAALASVWASLADGLERSWLA